MAGSKPKWTPEEDDRLRELWRSGLSAQECAAALGGMTRNKVLGRLWRLKEPPRVTAPEIIRLHQIKRRFPNGKPSRRQTLTPTEERAADNNPHKASNVGFLEAKSNQCREIVGHDGLAIFCGADVAHKSFCRYHAGINYTAPKNRQSLIVQEAA